MIINYPAKIELNLKTNEFTGWFPNFGDMNGYSNSNAIAKDLKFVLACLKSFIRDAIEYTKENGIPMPTPVIPIGQPLLDGDIFTFWHNIDTGDDQ